MLYEGYSSNEVIGVKWSHIRVQVEHMFLQIFVYMKFV